MYLSKARKRNIVISILVLICVSAVAAFILLQKPKIGLVQVVGSGYTGTELAVSVLPLESTVSYQWTISTLPDGTFVEIAGATSRTLMLTNEDVGKYFKVIVKGIEDYAGTSETTAFGPIKGISVTWPTTTPITYGQSISSSTLGEGIALINGVYVPGTFAFENSSLVPTKAGITKANVIFTPNDLVTYKPITTSINVTVNKALLTIKIANKSVTYGDFISTYDYEITGFLMNDTLSVVSGTPSITSVYSAGLSVSYNPVQIIGEIGSLTAENYDFTFIFGEIMIAKKTLTVVGITGRDKIYDGTTKASISGKARLSGVFVGDDVYLGGSPSFNFVQKTAGTNLKIIVKGYTLKGTKAGNYVLIQPTLYADIKPYVAP